MTASFWGHKACSVAVDLQDHVAGSVWHRHIRVPGGTVEEELDGVLSNAVTVLLMVLVAMSLSECGIVPSRGGRSLGTFRLQVGCVLFLLL